MYHCSTINLRKPLYINYKRFVIGVDRSKMKLFNVEISAQSNISDSGQDKEDKPLFDQSSMGRRLQTEGFKF